MHFFDWLLLIAFCACPMPLIFFLTLEIIRPAEAGTIDSASENDRDPPFEIRASRLPFNEQQALHRVV